MFYTIRLLLGATNAYLVAMFTMDTEASHLSLLRIKKELSQYVEYFLIACFGILLNTSTHSGAQNIRVLTPIFPLAWEPASKMIADGLGLKTS